MKYNISIILPKNICKYAVSISNQLSKDGGVFVLGKEVNFPHITIAHFECSNQIIIEAIIDSMQKNAQKNNHFNIIQDKYDIYKNEWIFVSFMLNNKLQKLEKCMIDILKKNDCEKTSKYFSEFPAHITFSRKNAGDVIDIDELLKYDFSFEVNKLGLFELGEHGTNKKLLKSVILQ